MAILKPITQSSFIVTITGENLQFPAIWTTFSGVNDSADNSTYPNPTGNRIFKVVGPRTLDDLTISAPYDPDLAAIVEEIWLNYQCQFLTIIVQPTNCDGATPFGQPYIMDGCQLTSLNVAEVDRESGSVATIELGFTANSWRRGN
jgi:hypothetical protein